MTNASRWITRVLAAALLPASSLAAQQPTTLTGTVYVGGGAGGGPQTGRPLPGASVFIQSLNVGTLTNDQGRYVLVVPAARARGQTVQVSASLIGYETVSEQVELVPGSLTQNFVLTEDPLKLEEIVVTGQGTQTTREKLGVTVTSVNADEVINSQEANVIGALAGKAPGVNITTSSGEPGAGSYIQIRGANTVFGGTQPLVVVDGVPINNESYSIESSVAGTVNTNRAFDINPNDIESIEILKGPAAGALYGSRAASGVLLITTKSGRAGGNRVSLKTSVSFENVNQMQDLQTMYGQGLSAAPFQALVDAGVLTPEDLGCPPGQSVVGCNLSPNSSVSWGPALDCAQVNPATGIVTSFAGCREGVNWFDHTDEIFRRGTQLETNLSMSGGTETTTYYLSVGRFGHEGVIDGNSNYNKTSARLKGAHSFTPTLTVSGNFNYTESGGDLVQQGSNISGLLLGTLRTPPDFNNEPYIDPATGLHRSYRYPNPTQLVRTRGYDNPFWIAREITNDVDVSRFISNVELDYQPFPWLNVSYLLGADVTDDNRLTQFPKSSSNFPSGQLIRANFTDKIFDSNLILTATREFSDNVSAGLSLGQNLNQQTFKRYQVNGFNLILGTDQLDYTVDQDPNETFIRQRTAGYFAQGNLDLWDQLFLTGALRVDGSSTFGGESDADLGDNYFIYPKASIAWNFTDLPGWQQNELLNFGKLRFAYGVTGKQPPAYTNVTGFVTNLINDGWISPNGLSPLYLGQEGVYLDDVQGNAGIQPERTTGWDAGLDLSFLSNKINLGLTYYNENTEDVIIPVPVAPSTGFDERWANAAEISNEGFEVTLGLRPYESDNFGISIDANWAANNSCVRDIAGAEFIGLNGFTGSAVGLFRPDTTANGEITRCYEYNTFFGADFIRFGRGIEVDGVNIDQAFPDAAAGALYIGENGFPMLDPQERPFGNANPDWTAGIRTTLNFFRRVSVSALVDVNQGSRMWNGTKGALYFFGTHEDTEPYHAAGQEVVFGDSYYAGTPVAGPGAGTPVVVDWNYFLSDIGSGFTGPFTQFVEDASFVKLRDVSVGINIDDDWFRPLSSLGFSSADIMLVGRNLVTWTDYTGIDPESNLTGQSAGRGLEYFNNPRVRAWTFTVTLNR